ncbi:hypothetical protein UlMin_037260 [Ulmus minor]
MDVKFQGSRLHNDKQDPLTSFSNLHKKITALMPKIDADNSRPKLMKKKIEDNKKRAEDLYQRLIEVELDCLKYNLPKFDRVQELQEYLKELQKYMKSWRDEAKTNRGKGYKSFKELLQQLHQSSQEGDFLSSEKVKNMLVCIGSKITRRLVDFMFLGSPTTHKVAKRLQLVRTALRCLTVEDNSIFMHKVSDILVAAEKKAKERNLIISISSNEGNLLSDRSPEECDIFRKILREFVRLEVFFCCPSLRCQYSDDVLIDMGKMFKQSEEKMNRISYKIGKLKKEAQLKLAMLNLKVLFTSPHIEIKWRYLDLQPNA